MNDTDEALCLENSLFIENLSL